MSGGRPVDRMGDVLRRAGLLDDGGLRRALDRQRVQPGRLGTHLLALGLITEEDLAKALAMHHRVPPFLPSLTPADPAAAARVPRELMRRLRAVPVAWDEERALLVVAAADPGNLAASDELRFAAGARRVAVQVTPDAVVDRLIRRHCDGVDEEPAAPRELSPEAAEPTAPRPVRDRREALLGDPDPKRRRALAALLEAAGYRPTRAESPGELQALLGKRPGTPAWVHEAWADPELPPGATVYDDPLAALGERRAHRLLRAEAEALAQEAARVALGADAAGARRALAVLRLLAGRHGVGGPAADALELRGWRAALGGWQLPDPGDALEGQELLAAVAAYHRAVARGASPAQAAEAVRGDRTLDPGAVISLLRWAVGARLLERLDARRPLATLFPPGREPAELLRHLTQAGWSVAPHLGPGAAPGAVLAALEPGLTLLEQWAAAASGIARPPVFLLAEGASEPDTMYALRLGAEDVFAPGTHPAVIETKLERAAARTAPGAGLVTGNLRDLGLAELVQVLAGGGRSGALRVEGPEGVGELWLVEGRIADARTPGARGEEALYEMIGWAEGAFRIDPAGRPGAETIHGSTEGLLMEGFRRLDERRRQEGPG